MISRLMERNLNFTC